MIQAKQRSQEKIKLSCRESRLLLRTIHLDKKDSEMSPEEQTACEHYYASYHPDWCLDCRRDGLSRIIGKGLSCQEALET